MSVAERIADERGESIGDTVGYSIRLESKKSSRTRLLFCTTGILLKRLEDDKDLANVTHVFIDEVHERGIETDFLLMVMRDLLTRRSQPLKLILMSATLDASLFHRYFGNAPSVKFPGRTFPVTELYLEHAIEATRHVVYDGADWAKNSRGKKLADKDGDPSDQPDFTREQYARGMPQFAPQTHQSLCALDHNAIDYALIVDTLAWLCTMNGPNDAENWMQRFKGRGQDNAMRGDEPVMQVSGATHIHLVQKL